MIRTFAAHTNESTIKSVDVRGDMTHDKPYGLLDHIRLVVRDDKSNRSNKEGKETAEISAVENGNQFWALPPARRCHALCVLVCACLLLFRNRITHPNPKCWSPHSTRDEAVVEQSGDRRADSYSQK